MMDRSIWSFRRREVMINKLPNQTINTRMSASEQFRAQQQANTVNKKVGVTTPGQKGFLGKDSFLKLLVTELRHQDPTKPMEDREFIAQMAQFSSLEQMMNINKEISSLLKSSRSSEAFALLGKEIDAFNQETGTRIQGRVSGIRSKNNSYLLLVGNREVSIDDVHAVRLAESANPVQQLSMQKKEQN
jgi:flagellar basal-body rod modification protein FlgD